MLIYQLIEMWFPGSDPSLVAWVDVGLWAWHIGVRVVGPGGLGGGRRVVPRRVLHHAPRRAHHPLLQRGLGFVLRIAQFLKLFFLFLLFFALPVGDKAHGGVD